MEELLANLTKDIASTPSNDPKVEPWASSSISEPGPEPTDTPDNISGDDHNTLNQLLENLTTRDTGGNTDWNDFHKLLSQWDPEKTAPPKSEIPSSTSVGGARATLTSSTDASTIPLIESIVGRCAGQAQNDPAVDVKSQDFQNYDYPAVDGKIWNALQEVLQNLEQGNPPQSLDRTPNSDTKNLSAEKFAESSISGSEELFELVSEDSKCAIAVEEKTPAKELVPIEEAEL